jgi:ABC-2 family transporter
MIRFSLLQFRIQALVALGGLLAVAILAAITGPHLAHLYATDIAGCQGPDCPGIREAFLGTDRTLRGWLNILVTVVPGIIGVFWGAPLVAREVETGTFRLAWTQSVTRTRWLATKLGVVAGISMVVAALLSLLITWWARPLDRARADRFATFEQRDLVPIGYAAFALALGVTLGILIRRTLPALATTLVLFAVARVAMTLWLRPRLISPEHLTATLQASRVGYGRKSSSGGYNLFPDPPDLPNAWISATRVVDDTGHALTSQDLSRLCPTLRLDGRTRGPE